jgi:hypothetical protein
MDHRDLLEASSANAVLHITRSVITQLLTTLGQPMQRRHGRTHNIIIIPLIHHGTPIQTTHDDTAALHFLLVDIDWIPGHDCREAGRHGGGAILNHDERLRLLPGTIRLELKVFG